jgi:hypothetical protein
MYRKLAAHNADIKQLVDKGYAIAVDSKHLVVRDVFYLDADRALKQGAIVTKLEYTNNDEVKQGDHQIFFAGGHPHNVDGTPIGNLSGGLVSVPLSSACDDVVVERSFSNKRSVNGDLVGFDNFFDKIEHYVGLFSGPARALHSDAANPLTYNVKVSEDENSVFKIHDTLTSRAEITELSRKFSDEVIAIIGLGGTGSYVLDFMVPTPAREIRGFDADPYHIHNAFRSPGRFEHSEFKKPKAEVYQARYDNFRHGLKLVNKRIDSTCGRDLDGVTFAFVCVDKGSARKEIFELLIAKGIPFIDVGLDLSRKRGPLDGMLRVSYFSKEDAQARMDMGLAELFDDPADEYRDTIQIGELNAMNAAMAVHKYKQVMGFYIEEKPTFNILFDVEDGKTVLQSA